MDAIIIDLKDFGTRTPEQVLRVFFAEYTPGFVEEALMDIFIHCALINGKENPETGLLLDDIAELFDQVIAIIRAIDQLRGDGCRCRADDSG